MRPRGLRALPVMLLGVGLAVVLLELVPTAGPDSPPPPSTAPPAPQVPGAFRCDAFAATTGSDTWPGSSSQPFRTVQRLVLALEPGDTGCLRTGTYTGAVSIDTDSTALRSAPGSRARLERSTLTVAADAEDVTVSDLDIRGPADALTVRVSGDGFVLEHNDISNDNRGTTCVLVGDSDHQTTAGVIRDNVIHGCGEPGSHLDQGIYAQNVDGLRIEDNLLFDVAGYAVQLFPRTTRSLVRHNVINGGGLSVRGGIVIDGPLAEEDRIEDNVILGTRTGAVVQRTGSRHVSRNNCFYGNDGNVSGDDITSDGDVDSSFCWLSLRAWVQGSADASSGVRPGRFS